MEKIKDQIIDYREELLKYILRIVGNISDAEDLVQDTLLTSIEKRGMLKNEDQYKSWLFRIGRNKAIDFLKRKNKFIELKPEYSDLEFVEEYCDCKTIKTLAANNLKWYNVIKKMYLEDKKSIEEIRTFMIKINPNIEVIPIEYIETMIYADLDQMTQAEIAEKTATPLATVKSRIQRARQKVKQIFFKCCDFEFDARGNIIDYYKKQST